GAMFCRPLKRAPGNEGSANPQSDDWGYHLTPAQAGCEAANVLVSSHTQGSDRAPILDVYVPSIFVEMRKHMRHFCSWIVAAFCFAAAGCCLAQVSTSENSSDHENMSIR